MCTKFLLSFKTSNLALIYILAITEGRGKARGEVGIAAIDVYRPNLIVSQITDCQMYSKSLAKISILSPVEVDFLNKNMIQFHLNQFF